MIIIRDNKIKELLVDKRAFSVSEDGNITYKEYNVDNRLVETTLEFNEEGRLVKKNQELSSENEISAYEKSEVATLITERYDEKGKISKKTLFYPYDKITTVEPIGNGKERTITFSEKHKTISTLIKKGKVVYETFTRDAYGRIRTYTLNETGASAMFIEPNDNFIIDNHNSENKCVKRVDVRGIKKSEMEEEVIQEGISIHVIGEFNDTYYVETGVDGTSRKVKTLASCNHVEHDLESESASAIVAKIGDEIMDQAVNRDGLNYNTLKLKCEELGFDIGTFVPEEVVEIEM